MCESGLDLAGAEGPSQRLTDGFKRGERDRGAHGTPWLHPLVPGLDHLRRKELVTAMSSLLRRFFKPPSRDALARVERRRHLQIVGLCQMVGATH